MDDSPNSDRTPRQPSAHPRTGLTMAPGGRRRQESGRTSGDMLWALGCVAYEMLTGGSAGFKATGVAIRWPRCYAGPGLDEIADDLPLGGCKRYCGARWKRIGDAAVGDVPGHFTCLPSKQSGVRWAHAPQRHAAGSLCFGEPSSPSPGANRGRGGRPCVGKLVRPESGPGDAKAGPHSRVRRGPMLRANQRRRELAAISRDGKRSCTSAVEGQSLSYDQLRFTGIALRYR